MDTTLPPEWCIIDLKPVPTSSNYSIQEMAIFRGSSTESWFFHCETDIIDDTCEIKLDIYPNSKLPFFLKRFTANASFVFVRGTDMVSFFKPFFTCEIIDLDIFKYTDYILDIIECFYHSGNPKQCAYRNCLTMRFWLQEFVTFETERRRYINDNSPLLICNDIDMRFSPFSLYESFCKVHCSLERLYTLVSFPSVGLKRFWKRSF